MTRSDRTRRDTRIGYALIAAGVLITVGWFVLVALVYNSPYKTQHTLRPGPVYLSGAFRDQARTCTLMAADGTESEIRIPAMPKRGLQLAGIVIGVPSTGLAAVTCDSEIHATVGLLARMSGVGEQWLVAFLGLTVTAVGLDRLGWLYRPTRLRYP